MWLFHPGRLDERFKVTRHVFDMQAAQHLHQWQRLPAQCTRGGEEEPKEPTVGVLYAKDLLDTDGDPLTTRFARPGSGERPTPVLHHSDSKRQLFYDSDEAIKAPWRVIDKGHIGDTPTPVPVARETFRLKLCLSAALKQEFRRSSL
jgi:hypothetical protein